MALKKELLKRLDHYVRIVEMTYNLNRWLGLRIDSLGVLFTISLASYLVYGNNPLGAANTGFTLNMCLDFCTMILWRSREYLSLKHIILWVEFYVPIALLQKKAGMLKALVDRSRDKAMLYSMAEGNSVMPTRVHES